MGHIQHKNVDGLDIPSVSEISGIYAKDISGFEDWICEQVGDHTCCTKARREFYKESADLGHDIHALREGFLKGEQFSEGVPEYEARLFEPVARFYKDNQYTPLMVEEAITGERFGGSFDGVGRFGVPFWEKERKTFWDVSCEGVKPTTDSIFIDDLKIKSKLEVTHPLQLYGYRELLKLKGVSADWGLIIRREKKLDKRPELQLRCYYLPYFKSHWEASLLMYHFLKR